MVIWVDASILDISGHSLCHVLQSFCGEGNGTPLQYSCLENPMDGGAWWVAVHGVTRSRTWLSDFTFTFHFHVCIWEGNGNPLQCSCLENPRDRGAWWAAVYGVAQSRTRLKWLSSNSSTAFLKAFVGLAESKRASFILSSPLLSPQFLG